MKKIRKIGMIMLIFLGAMIIFTTETTVANPESNALIILNSTDMNSMKQSINFIEKRGGRIVHKYPTHILIGYVPMSISQDLIGQAEILEIHHGIVDSSTVQNHGKTAVYAVDAWDNNFMGVASAKGLTSESKILEPGPIVGDALLVPESAKGKHLQGEGPQGAESHEEILGQAPPYGAGFYDTSVYMIGDIAVGIIFLESNGSIDLETENWTSTEESNVISEIQAGLNWWIAREPNAKLTFTYDIHYRVPTSYEPISRPGPSSSGQQLWITDAMNNLSYTNYSSYFDNVYDYENDLRTTKNTDWAFTIFVVDSSNGSNTFTDGYFAYAYLGGPFMVMTYDNDGYGIANMDAVTAHENGHIFYALDQYSSAPTSCTERSGYLNIENQNYDNTTPCLSDVDSIMRGQVSPYTSGAIDVYARGQVGWNDTDGDNILDILDTFPNSTLNPYLPDPTNDNTPTYNGSTTVSTYPNSNPNPAPWNSGNNITINTLTNVQYRVDGGAWINATSTDGLFNDSTENFTFTTSQLLDGNHTIEVRANNSVSNLEITLATDILFVDANSPTMIFITPVSNENVSGSIYVNVTVSDGNGTGVNTVLLQNGTSGNWVTMSRYEGDASKGNYSILWNSTDFSDGTQILTINATDDYGHSNATEFVTVMVDNTPPTITITSPQNISYSTISIWFNATILDASDVNAGLVQYGDFNHTLDNSSGNWNHFNDSMSEGSYSAVFYANDSIGNANTSTVYFSIDMTPPTWSDNQTSTKEARANALFSVKWQDVNGGLSHYIFGTNDSGVWVNDTPVKMTGISNWSNVTKTLNSTSGIEIVWRVWVNDTAGNWNDTGNLSLITTDDVTPPTITITSPENITYTSSSVALNYDINEPTDWVAYSLDGGANQTLSGNTTLSGLSNAPHNVTIYANDTVGNMGSNTTYFTVNVPAPSGGGGGGGGGRISPIKEGVSALNSSLMKDIISNLNLEYKFYYDAPKALASVLITVDEYPSVNEKVTPVLVRTIQPLQGDVYELAAEKILENFMYANTLYIARGDLHVDSMAAVTYAKMKHVPIILTKTEELPEPTLEVINKLQPKNIVIMGGPVAISSEVEDKLSEMAEVERIWGDTRYETSVEMAKSFALYYKYFDTIVIADGNDPSTDAAIVASGYKAPLLYVRGNEIPQDVKTFLEDHKKEYFGRQMKLLTVGVTDEVGAEIEEFMSS